MKEVKNIQTVKPQKNLLTNAEMEVMEILWAADRPMTSADVLDSGRIGGWSSGYLHNTLRALLKKDVIRVNGMVQVNTQYARLFEPSITKPEYAARMALSTGITAEYLPELVEELKKQMEGQRAAAAERMKE